MTLSLYESWDTRFASSNYPQIDGLILYDRPNEASAKRVAGPKQVKNCKIGLIQFCLSPPKTNV